MKVIISSTKHHVISLLVENVEIDSMISLLFRDVESSRAAFEKIKSLGMPCYHTGKNAPCGPSVSVCNNHLFNIKIQ